MVLNIKKLKAILKKDTFLVVRGSVFQQIINLLLIPILANAMGASEYGKLATYVAIVNSVIAFGTTSFSINLVQKSAVHYSQHGSIGRHYLYCTFFAVIYGLAVLIFFISYSLGSNFIEDFFLISLIYFLTASRILLDFVKYGFQSVQDFKLYSFCLWLPRIFYLLLSFSVLLFFHTNLSINFLICLVIAYSLSVFFLTLKLFFNYLDLHNSRLSFDIQGFLTSTTPNFFSSWINYFFSSVFIILIISRIAETKVVAAVSIAYAINGLLLMPSRWVGPTLLPKLSVSASKKGARNKLLDSQNGFIYFLIFISLSTLILSLVVGYSPIVTLFLGETFVSASAIIILMLGLVGAEALQSFSIKIIWAKKKDSIPLICNLLVIIPLLVSIFLLDEFLTIILLVGFSLWIRTLAMCYFVYSRDNFIKIAILTISWLFFLVANYFSINFLLIFFICLFISFSLLIFHFRQTGSFLSLTNVF